LENAPADAKIASRTPAAGQPSEQEIRSLADAEKPAAAATATSPAAMPPAGVDKSQESGKFAAEQKPISATGSLQGNGQVASEIKSDFSAKLQDSQPAVDAFAREIAAADSGLLVVRVDVSPEAARRGEFDTLLAKNRITLEDRSRAAALRGRVLK